MAAAMVAADMEVVAVAMAEEMDINKFLQSYDKFGCLRAGLLTRASSPAIKRNEKSDRHNNYTTFICIIYCKFILHNDFISFIFLISSNSSFDYSFKYINSYYSYICLLFLKSSAIERIDDSLTTSSSPLLCFLSVIAVINQSSKGLDYHFRNCSFLT
jgi:hypothetical protein